MADGIDIRLKRGTYYNPETKQPNENVANYRLLYGEAIYLSDLDYLVIGCKGFITYKEPNTEGSDSTIVIPDAAVFPTGYSGEYAANGYDKLGFSVEELLRCRRYFADWSVLEKHIDDLLVYFRGNDTPKMDSGDGDPGTSLKFSREDHVHPSDTTKADVNWPTLKANSEFGYFPQLDTTPPQSYDDQYGKLRIPTLEWVARYVAEHKEKKRQVEFKDNESETEKRLMVCGVTEEDGDLLYDSGVYVYVKKEDQSGEFTSGSGVLMGAAWNDFAEYRKCDAEPGTVVCETGKGNLEISRERLQPGAYIVSDTYGMVIGPQGPDYSPVAVAGRALAKYSGKLEDYKPGMPVCSNKDGKISPMSREEITYYPETIVGYVSEIPEYKIWNHVKIGNRIWIKVR